MTQIPENMCPRCRGKLVDADSEIVCSTCGMVVERVPGSNPTPLKPTKSRLPIKPEIDEPKARLYPTNSHTKLITHNFM